LVEPVPDVRADPLDGGGGFRHPSSKGMPDVHHVWPDFQRGVDACCACSFGEQSRLGEPELRRPHLNEKRWQPAEVGEQWRRERRFRVDAVQVHGSELGHLVLRGDRIERSERLVVVRRRG